LVGRLHRGELLAFGFKRPFVCDGVRLERSRRKVPLAGVLSMRLDGDLGERRVVDCGQRFPRREAQLVLEVASELSEVVDGNRPLVLCMERAPESEQSGNPLWTGTFEVLAVLEPVHTHSRNVQHHWRNYKHALHKVNETICFPDGEEHHVQFVPDDAWWRTGVLHKFAKYKWLSEIPRIRLEDDQRTIHHTFSSNA
jgi:hypothetical protein